ncbi:MAG: hypothetical protein FJX76_18890 [Armatimonadetes bacterium]|nr:hypothetical protein [Armatimonadota bacterium]
MIAVLVVTDEALGDGPVPDRYDAAVGLARAVASIVEKGHGLVLALACTPHVAFDTPFDSSVAEAAAGVGYLITQALGNELKMRGLETKAAMTLVRAEVDYGHPTFLRPEAPVGPLLEDPEHAHEVDWELREEPGGWRRVVASPPPLDIPDEGAVRALLEEGTAVVAAGYVPVVKDERGLLMGVSALVDPHAAAGMLARRLGGTMVGLDALETLI